MTRSCLRSLAQPWAARRVSGPNKTPGGGRRSARFAAESAIPAARTTHFLLSMSSKLIRPRRALPLLAVLVACVSLPAIASAATSFTVKWSRSALLENPNKGGALLSVACAPAGATADGDDHYGHNHDWQDLHEPERSAAVCRRRCQGECLGRRSIRRAPRRDGAGRRLTPATRSPRSRARPRASASPSTHPAT